MKILIAKFFQTKRSMKRGHTAALVKSYCRLDKRKVSSQRTINDRNQLNHDCVNASSVNMFKIKLTIIWQGRAIPRLKTDTDDIIYSDIYFNLFIIITNCYYCRTFYVFFMILMYY